MDEKLKDLLVAGAMFIASLVWASVKSAKEKRRKNSGRSVSMPQHRAATWSAYGNNAADDYSGHASHAASGDRVVQQPAAQQPADRRDTALTLPPVAADEAASVSGIDGETLRQAVKWSVILEKKF